MTNTFVDIHVLQTVPPSCINRDETGSPKTALFGGVRRARVSSQAWKRAAREEFNSHLDPMDVGVRTKHAVDQVAEQIVAQAPELAEDAETLAAGVLTAAGISVRANKDKTKQETGYLLFLSRRQVEALASLAIDTQNSGEKVRKADAKAAVKERNSIDVALFGRMVADSPDLNVDASCQVSHALSVHAAANEFDYFTASDDDPTGEHAGAGMIGTVEFVSSTLYRYATISVAQLIENLGSGETAANAVKAFIKSFTVSMPTGKQNTFANRTRPGLVLVRVRGDQPVNLVGAFETPLEGKDGHLREAMTALLKFAKAEDESYGTSPLRSVALLTQAVPELSGDLDGIEQTNLEGLAEAAATAVMERHGI